MIVKMKFINISGPRNDIDRVTDLYLSRYEIQLESALSELKTVDNLRPFVEINPYKDALGKAEEFAGYLENADEITPDTSLGLDDIFELIRTTNEAYLKIQSKKETLKKETETLLNKQKLIEPFRPLDGELDRILHYKYINYRFGRIPVEQYGRLEKYLMDDLGAIFVKGEQDESYLYGVYFVSPGEAQKAPQIVASKQRLEELAHNFDVRKMAARMEDQKEDYYILCGWMSEDDVTRFMEEVKDDDKVFVVVEEDRNTYFGEPPVKLQNPKLFKPFEMFIGMYGLPAHNEIDPTIFVAITYSFIFGVMFGDVGQGLLLLIGGFFVYHFKKKPLAGIIACAGVFSTIFGLMFGSIFGFEDIIEPLWLRPIDHMTTLPFIGKLNTVFIVSVAFGMGLIIFAMILHIINALRSHDVENAWFDANGMAGLVFYASAVVTIVLFMTGHKTPAGIVLAVMFGIPLLLILFKEPLTRKIQKRADKMEEGKAMFFVQGFFEIFETLLSYFSNTLSFVRIGAFAVSHAAMMEVVLMLAGAESGSPNWIVVVLGNLFVCGMEGLIVGIQVLRLEYYEMFSRFYKGSGRAFDPYTKTQTTKKKRS